MSFQEDIRRYLDDETLPLMQKALFERIGLPTVGTVYTTRRWCAPQPSRMPGLLGGEGDALKLLRAGIIAAAKQLDLPKDADPVDAWEPRICEDGVIIRGPPSEDTPPKRPTKE